MTITLNHNTNPLTVEVEITNGPRGEHFEVTSITDEAGREVHNCPVELLDEIEESVEEERSIAAWVMEQEFHHDFFAKF